MATMLGNILLCGFIYLIPIFFIFLLWAFYKGVARYVSERQARDLKLMLSGLRIVFTITSLLLAFIVLTLMLMYSKSSLYLQDIMLFYFILPLFIPLMFILLSILSLAITAFVFLFRKKLKPSARKMYSFSLRFRTASFFITVISLFVAFKYANYIYLTGKVNSLNATERELRQVYPRAISFASIYLDSLFFIPQNPRCPSDVLRSYVDDIDRLHLADSDKSYILSIVASHPNTPTDLLERLSRSADTSVSKRAGHYLKQRLSETDSLSRHISKRDIKQWADESKK